MRRERRWNVSGCNYRPVCQRDLEGIVAKWKRGMYVEGERTSWVKIKNRDYSQAVGREKLFEKQSTNHSSGSGRKNNASLRASPVHNSPLADNGDGPKIMKQHFIPRDATIAELEQKAAEAEKEAANESEPACNGVTG